MEKENSFNARSESIERNRLQKYAKAYQARVHTGTVNTSRIGSDRRTEQVHRGKLK